LWCLNALPPGQEKHSDQYQCTGEKTALSPFQTLCALLQTLDQLLKFRTFHKSSKAVLRTNYPVCQIPLGEKPSSSRDLKENTYPL
jgi:hypothetical protein